MIICRQRLDFILTEQCRALSDLRRQGFGPATLTRIRGGQGVSSRTARKLAQALGVPLEQLTVTSAPGCVVIDRVKLTVETASRGLTERQLLEQAGVQPYDAVAIGNGRAITLGTAWRMADALGIPFERLLY